MSLDVVITNFNRLKSLRKLVPWLRCLRGVGRIYIFDYASTYPPLLDWYADEGRNYDVLRLPRNYGCGGASALIPVILQSDEPIVVTDPDLEPLDNTPDDLLSVMQDRLNRYPEMTKVGPGLDWTRVAEYPYNRGVREYERRLMEGPELDSLSVLAPIDTTFALHRNVSLRLNSGSPAIRLKSPYTLRHPDWEIDPGNLDEEDSYYAERCNAGSSSFQRLKAGGLG